MGKNKANDFQKGFRKLRDKNLVRRTKRGHYMINPNALVVKRYSDAVVLWDASQPDTTEKECNANKFKCRTSNT